jgi:hypothetical protein
VKFPIIQRVEEWISLQPNAGVYFQSGQPNNGQNFKFENYGEANAVIKLVYSQMGTEYTFENTQRLKFVGEDVATPYPLIVPDSTINGVYNVDLTAVTTFFAGNQYVLRLNNRLPYPTEYCISIKAVYEEADNVFTWGTIYPTDSDFSAFNTYQRVFDSQQPDLYYFTPPRAGRLKFYVVFTKEHAGLDNIITRTITIDVEEPVFTSIAPPKVETLCCEVLEVEPTDFSTIIWDSATIGELYLEGELVAEIDDNSFGTLYAYDLIRGIQAFTIDWSLVYAAFGYGGYQVIAGTFESDIYCVVENVADSIVVDLTLDNKIGLYNFKDNPLRLYYRFKGFISSDSVSVEREEVKFYNGNILNVKQSNERNYGVVIKKCIYRIYNELANFGIFAKLWKLSDFNQANPIAHKDLRVLPPAALNPEWQYRTNFAVLEFDTKSNNSISSGKC